MPTVRLPLEDAQMTSDAHLRGILVCAVLVCASPVQAQTVKIVALGASNTDGWGVSPSEAYPARLQALMHAKGIDASVANAGIPGDTTGGMLARLDSAAPAGTHIVILQPGTNDEAMGLGAERAANIDKMRKALAARNAKLIVIDKLDALPRSELRGDGLHFTPAGYALLAERILPQVLAALGK
jgi:acyl-CoA thioesterase-1